MMTVSEYANSVNKTIDDILKLCHSLEIDVDDSNDMLSEDDINSLDYKIQEEQYSLNDSNTCSDSEIDLSCDNIHYGLKFIKAIEESFGKFTSALSGLDLETSGLKSASLFSDVKTSFSNFNSGSSDGTISDLRDKVEKIRDIMSETDINASFYFSYLDGDFDDEFGNYDEAKAQEYIDNKINELYEEAEKKAQDEYYEKLRTDSNFRYETALNAELSENGFESLEEIDSKREKLLDYVRELQKQKNAILFSDAQVTLKFLNMVNNKYMGICSSFDGIADNETLVYKYVDKYGIENFSWTLDGVPKDYQKSVDALSYTDMCSGSELYNQVKSGFDGNWFFTSPFNSEYKKLNNTIQEQLVVENEKLDEINKSLNINREELAKLDYTKQSIINSAKYLSEDVWKYKLNEDFEENCSNVKGDEISSVLNDLKDKAVPMSFNSDSFPMFNKNYLYLSDEEEKQVIYSLISGSSEFISGDGSVSYFDSSGRQVYLKTNNSSMLSNMSLWASEMDETQKQIFFYNWNTAGSDAAYQYLNSISDELDAVYVNNRRTEDEAFAGEKENRGWASAASVMLGPFEGMKSLEYSVTQLINNDKMYSSHLYSHGDTMRAKVSSDIASSGSKYAEVNAFMYNVSMSIADNLYSMALSGGFGVKAIGVDDVAVELSKVVARNSGLILGLGGFDNNMNDALSRGLTDEKAFMYSLSMSGVEALTEAVSIDNLLDLKLVKNADDIIKDAGKFLNASEDVVSATLKTTDNVIDKLKKIDKFTDTTFEKVVFHLDDIIDPKYKESFLVKLVYKGANLLYGTVKQGSGEGMEELASSIMGEWVDKYFAGDNSAFNLSVENYINLGYSEAESISLTQQQQIEEFAMSYLSGLTSGSISGGGKLAGSMAFGDISASTSNLIDKYKNPNFDATNASLVENVKNIGTFVDNVIKRKTNPDYDVVNATIAQNIRNRNFEGAIDFIMNQDDKSVVEKTVYASSLISLLSNKDNRMISENMQQKLTDMVQDYVESNSNVEETKVEVKTNKLFNTVSYNVDPVHGFQINQDSFGGFFKSKIESGFFSSQQIETMLNRVNSKGYVSESTGKYFSELFSSEDYDIYVKTIHSNDLTSIIQEGVRCLGTSTSGYGVAPTSVSGVNLDNTVTKVDGVYDLFTTLKGANGISQGMNPIDGTLILKVPKGTDKKDILYFSESSGTYCIKPEYIDCFSAVDENGVVSEPVFNDKVVKNLSINDDRSLEQEKVNVGLSEENVENSDDALFLEDVWWENWGESDDIEKEWNIEDFLVENSIDLDNVDPSKFLSDIKWLTIEQKEIVLADSRVKECIKKYILEGEQTWNFYDGIFKNVDFIQLKDVFDADFVEKFFADSGSNNKYIFFASAFNKTENPDKLIDVIMNNTILFELFNQNFEGFISNIESFNDLLEKMLYDYRYGNGDLKTKILLLSDKVPLNISLYESLTTCLRRDYRTNLSRSIIQFLIKNDITLSGFLNLLDTKVNGDIKQDDIHPDNFLIKRNHVYRYSEEKMIHIKDIIGSALFDNTTTLIDFLSVLYNEHNEGYGTRSIKHLDDNLLDDVEKIKKEALMWPIDLKEYNGKYYVSSDGNHRSFYLLSTYLILKDKYKDNLAELEKLDEIFQVNAVVHKKSNYDVINKLSYSLSMADIYDVHLDFDVSGNILGIMQVGDKKYEITSETQFVNYFNNYLLSLDRSSDKFKKLIFSLFENGYDIKGAINMSNLSNSEKMEILNYCEIFDYSLSGYYESINRLKELKQEYSEVRKKIDDGTATEIDKINVEKLFSDIWLVESVKDCIKSYIIKNELFVPIDFEFSKEYPKFNFNIDCSLNVDNRLSLNYLLGVFFNDFEFWKLMSAIEYNELYDSNYTNKEILYGIVRILQELNSNGYHLDISKSNIGKETFYNLFNSLNLNNTEEAAAEFVETYMLKKSDLSINSKYQFYKHSDGRVGSDQHAIANAFSEEKLSTENGKKFANDLIEQVKNKFPGISSQMAMDFLKRIDSTVMSDGTKGTGGICNYADVANAIFEYFHSLANPYEEFERVFGFPMYRDGHLNDTQLLLDMFINISGNELISKGFFGKYKLNINNRRYLNLATNYLYDHLYRADYIGKYLRDKGIFDSNDIIIQKQLFNSKHIEYSSNNYISNSTLSYDKKYVFNYLMKNIHNALKNGEHLSIASWEGLKMVREDGQLTEIEHDEAHIMSIYGIDDDGNLLVDSWKDTWKIDLMQLLNDDVAFVIGSLSFGTTDNVSHNGKSNLRNVVGSSNMGVVLQYNDDSDLDYIDDSIFYDADDGVAELDVIPLSSSGMVEDSFLDKDVDMSFDEILDGILGVLGEDLGVKKLGIYIGINDVSSIPEKYKELLRDIPKQYIQSYLKLKKSTKKLLLKKKQINDNSIVNNISKLDLNTKSTADVEDINLDPDKGLIKFSKYIEDSIKQMAFYYGDAGIVNGELDVEFGKEINKMFLEGKTTNEILIDLFGERKLAFEKFLESKQGKFLSRLTSEQIKAFSIYSRCGAGIINKRLRLEYGDLDKIYDIIEGEYVAELIELLDLAIEEYGGLDVDTILYRAVTVESFFSHKNDLNKNDLNSLFKGLKKNNLQNDLVAVFAVLSSQIGKIDLMDYGFMSTSPGYSTSFASEDKYPIVLEIVAPKGTSGAYINQISSSYNKENEFLLSRGTKFSIDNVSLIEDVNGKHKILVRCAIKN